MKTISNKRGAGGQIAVWLLVLGIFALVGIMGYYAYSSIHNTSQQGVSSQQNSAQVVTQTALASKDGKVSNLGVYVYDMENNNVNTKVAVPIYCLDEKGQFVIDGTTSSTTVETTGNTEIGRTVTCYAFNSTYQSNPTVTVIDSESPHVVVHAFRTLGNGYGHLQFYTDTFVTGTGGTVNVTAAGSGGSGTFNKMRFTNNQSNNAYWLGGFYIDKVTGSNVSSIDMAGSASLSGMDHGSTLLVDSTAATRVSSRSEQWNFVWEVDDDSATSGNQPLLMHQNDYLETGSVKVTANGNGCRAANPNDLLTSYAFQDGWYRSQIDNTVKFGFESDATSPAIIGTDVVGDTFYCQG